MNYYYLSGRVQIREDFKGRFSVYLSRCGQYKEVASCLTDEAVRAVVRLYDES